MYLGCVYSLLSLHVLSLVKNLRAEHVLCPNSRSRKAGLCPPWGRPAVSLTPPSRHTAHPHASAPVKTKHHARNKLKKYSLTDTLLWSVYLLN